MKNLEGATFEEKRDIVNKLDIRVYPSEDLKTMKIKCGLKLMVEGDNKGACRRGRVWNSHVWPTEASKPTALGYFEKNQGVRALGQPTP